MFHYNCTDGQLSISSCPTRNSSNSSSESNSPLPSPDEEMNVPESFDTGVVLLTTNRSANKGPSLISMNNLDTFSGTGTHLPMYAGLSNNFQSSETSSSLNNPMTSLPVKNPGNSFYPPITATSNLLHNAPGILTSPKSHSDFSSLSGYPSLPIPDHNERTSRSSMQGFQPSVLPSPSSGLRQSGDHLSSPGDFTVSQPNLYSPSTQTSQTHEQSPILPPQSLLPSLKTNIPQCSSFSVYSLSSSAPTFITQSSQTNLGSRMLPSCGSPAQSFPTSSHHQQQHFGQTQITQHSIVPGVVSDLANTPAAGHSALSSSMVGRSLPGFAALNVPYSHSNSSTTLTGSNSLSLFPTVQGMYPYTQFVGIPAQINNPFTPAGLQMPGAQNQVPTGYPYLANVPHSLYNPQISTTTYSR